MNPKGAVPFIEGEPKIGVVPIDPGLSNKEETADGLSHMIGLSNELPEHDEKYELHRLLGALLSKSLSATEKLKIIETEYDIPVEENIREEVSDMCNLSQGIREDATRVATEEAVKRMIISMHEYGDNAEKIAMITKKSVEEVKAIIAGKEPVLV